MSAIPSLTEAWPILVAYLAGATPFGYLAGKMRGVDLRQHGSGNIGATNAIRVLGKPIGISVLLLDVLKGLLPVLLAKSLTDSSLIQIGTAMGAILGHTYTFWLRFKGGKGVATTAGALLPILPWTILAALVAWVVTLLLTRYVSVSSIVAAITIPCAIAVQSLIQGRWDFIVLIFGFILCLLVIWKHRSNIVRLRQGNENRVQFGRSRHHSSNTPS